MIDCFIDPIYLAINESITSKHYSEAIFPLINDFYTIIEDFEAQSKKREIQFNITFEFILSCIEYNPYRFSSRIYCSIWFKKFLSYFLKLHRNPNCDIISSNSNITNKYKYKNEAVPDLILEKWNNFLNNCDNCSSCNKKSLEFLSHEELGSKVIPDSPDFFRKTIYKINDWIKDKLSLIINQTPPIEINDLPESKKKGDWSHSKTKNVMLITKKLLNSKYVREIRPIGKSRRVNSNIIEIEDFQKYRVFIKDSNGTHIFIVITTAKNTYHRDIILENISNLIPRCQIKT